MPDSIQYDILIPWNFESRWTKRIKPALEALGVGIDLSLLDMLGAPERASLWPLTVRRPKPGSVLEPVAHGKSYRACDTILHLNEEGSREPGHGLVHIDHLYGMSALVSPSPPGIKEQVEWEDHPLLAVSTDFITIVADILPGKDAFVGVEIWANALLPIAVMAQNPLGFTSEIKVGAFKNLKKGEVELRMTCRKCAGSSSLQCRKCEGRGRWQPEGSCRKCEGSGSLACSRCKGVGGGFTGKYGERIDHCNQCSGTGSRICFKCKGTGEPPIIACPVCSGTGSVSCRPCSGEGTTSVGFDLGKGVYFANGSDLADDEVHALDRSEDRDYLLFQGAMAFLEQLEKEASAAKSLQAQIASTQAEIAKISQCLDLAMESQGATSEQLDFRPALLGSAEASIHRAKKRLILRFLMPKPPSWAKEGQTPFPVSTPLRLTTDPYGRNEIELARVGKDPLKRPVDLVFHGLEMIGGQRYFLISLPADVAMDRLPEKSWVKPNLIPPSELAQLKELRRWLRPADAPRLLEFFSVAPQSSKPAEPPKVKAVDPNITSNPRQQEVLNWIMSEVPLMLVKGPPGTGKTTVITEVALQSIARGEKILVCSETHQAVANVLEKLHDDADVRMIRHARSDNPKLTKLEKEYLEDGSRQGFLREVQNRSAQQAKAGEKLREALAPLPALLESARRAATELKILRESLDLRGEVAQQKAVSCGQSAAQSKETRCQEAENEQAVAIATIEAARTRSQKALDRAAQTRDKAQEARENAKAAFVKKAGREPDPKNALQASVGGLSELLPNILASQKLLHARFCAAEETVTKSTSEIEQCHKEISENKEQEALCRHRRNEAIQEAEAEASRALKQAEVELHSEQAAVAGALREVEEKFLPAQERVAATCNASGTIGPCTGNQSPDLWTQRLAECNDKIGRNEEQLEFCLRWQKAIESSTQELSSLFWDTTQVFLSTCVGLASWKSFASHFGKEGVDLVIIDEAAHATLTQSLIPLGKAKRAVLIGDEMQLPPAPPMELADRCEQTCAAGCPKTITQTETSHHFKPPMSPCWLERSAFEWITETRPWVPKLMLNRQFRMHPDIADFVADVFYEGGLENGVTAENRHLVFGDFTKAVCLVSTSAYRDRFETRPFQHSTSLQNPLEVELTRRILKQALRDLAQKTSFGVVTPYEAQKTLMQRELVDLFGSAGRLDFEREDIASVDSFQGSERDVMVASFVRSPPKCAKCQGSGRSGGQTCRVCRGRGWQGPSLSWVHDLRRLNVAFSRARKMLILVGDVEALTDPNLGTEKGSVVLSRFRDHVADRGRVLHVWEEKEHE